MTNATKYPRIKMAKPQPEKRLFVEFENGVIKIYDCTPLLEHEVFRPLRDEAFSVVPMLILMVTVSFGTMRSTSQSRKFGSTDRSPNQAVEATTDSTQNALPVAPHRRD